MNIWKNTSMVNWVDWSVKKRGQKVDFKMKEYMAFSYFSYQLFWKIKLQNMTDFHIVTIKSYIRYAFEFIFIQT